MTDRIHDFMRRCGMETGLLDQSAGESDLSAAAHLQTPDRETAGPETFRNDFAGLPLMPPALLPDVWERRTTACGAAKTRRPGWRPA